jgi:hypothetical protein
MTTGQFTSYVQRIHSSALMTLTADDFAAEMVRRPKDPAAVYVRLTGLVGAAHLNGREGVLVRTPRDPSNSEERVAVRLENGEDGSREVSVRCRNYATVQRPKLFIEEFV